MSEAKARELREMVAAWRSKWPNATAMPLDAIELYAANLAAVPAPAEPRVPREPTPEMIDAGFVEWVDAKHYKTNARPRPEGVVLEVWRAMYDAAPAAEPAITPRDVLDMMRPRDAEPVAQPFDAHDLEESAPLSVEEIAQRYREGHVAETNGG